MTTYSAVGDLLTGNIPLPVALDPAKFVQDATDEIDSMIGHIYATPVNVAEDSPVKRPARLLLKRLANFLASGRLMMAADAAGQDTVLHAYALRLISEATIVLNQLASGELRLDGALPADGAETVNPSGPLMANVDPESNVEAFYDRILNPYYPPGTELLPSRYIF